jgi:hypothetical protein
MRVNKPIRVMLRRWPAANEDNPLALECAPQLVPIDEPSVMPPPA